MCFSGSWTEILILWRKYAKSRPSRDSLIIPPKTRSGKIMRRLLRDVAEGRALGDTTTLADPAVVEALKQQYGEEE